MELDILFSNKRPNILSSKEPEFFYDLNLDQLINNLCKFDEKTYLKNIFYTLLLTKEDISYRQEIFFDLEKESIFNAITNFINNFKNLEKKKEEINNLYNYRQKQKYFLDLINNYIEQILELLNNFEELAIQSKGLQSLKEYLSSFVKTKNFILCKEEANFLLKELKKITYCISISGNTITVKDYETEENYIEIIEQVFNLFRQGNIHDYLYKKFPNHIQMNQVEEKILEYVVQLNSEIFEKLDIFYKNYQNFFDNKIYRCYQDIQFYLIYLEYIQNLDISFCYPKIEIYPKEIFMRNSCNIVLAEKLSKESKSIVCNDFQYKADEKILIILGPNQGGKTTYAKMIGQIFYLANLGCPVPGKYGILPLCDNIFTHFEKEEDIKNKNSKLQDELIRMNNILKKITSQSLIIMNESFSSTSLYDGIFLGKNIINKILEKNCLCVYVTFLDELIEKNPSIVSLVSIVNDDIQKTRTYKIERKNFNGQAYALSIVEKYHLTYKDIKKRIN